MGLLRGRRKPRPVWGSAVFLARLSGLTKRGFLLPGFQNIQHTRHRNTYTILSLKSRLILTLLYRSFSAFVYRHILRTFATDGPQQVCKQIRKISKYLPRVQQLQRWPSAHEKTLSLPLQNPSLQENPQFLLDQLSIPAPSRSPPQLQNSSSSARRAVKFQQRKCDALSHHIEELSHSPRSKNTMFITLKLIRIDVWSAERTFPQNIS